MGKGVAWSSAQSSHSDRCLRLRVNNKHRKLFIARQQQPAAALQPAGMASSTVLQQQQEAVATSSSCKIVQFTNACGLKLSGTYTRSTSMPGSRQCIILCHGYCSHKEGFQLPALANGLAAAGYNSLRFDFQGNGDSEGAFRFANYTGEAADVQAAKQYLEQQESQEVAALLGHSKGGSVVILYASIYADIPLIINVAGRFWMDQGITARFGQDIFDRVKAGRVTLSGQRDDGYTFEWQLTKEDMMERLHTDMSEAAALIEHCKVLTIHGTADTTIPIKDGRQFAAVVPNCSLVEVEGADHNFRTSPDHVKQLIDAVVSFLNSNAQQPAAQ
eukprot:GHRR01006580.1.p1 GENE.GHRR01006580.1~~GHRR01006580.1.p1  ORF type:complete len:331 (+),score=107.37 GHRR01006580.1:101-1093(+)